MGKIYSKIETERLVMREWTLRERDINDVVEGLNNYDVAKNLTTPFPYAKSDALQYIEHLVKEPNNETLMHFAVEHKADGKVIGGTHIAVGGDNTASGGIWLNSEYHGKGYGTEIWRARAKFCFDELNVKSISSGYLVGNEISRKLHEKIGFVSDGEGENNCPARGGKTKEYKLILTKEDFERKQGLK